MKKLIIFDLDGVIAEGLALEEYSKDGAFLTPKVVKGARYALEVIKRLGWEMRVCSKTFQEHKHIQEKAEKIMWLTHNNLMDFFTEIVILPPSGNKKDLPCLTDGSAILIDDYSGNRVKNFIQMFEHKKKDWATADSWAELINILMEMDK